VKLDTQRLSDAYCNTSAVGPVLSIVGTLFDNKDILLCGLLITGIETFQQYRLLETFERLDNEDKSQPGGVSNEPVTETA